LSAFITLLFATAFSTTIEEYRGIRRGKWGWMDDEEEESYHM